MIINKDIAFKRTATWLAIIFAAAQLFFLILADQFEVWNEQALDGFIAWRASTRFAPLHDKAIVLVDLDNTSLKILDHRLIDRDHHARVIASLAAMHTGPILYDFVFAGAATPEADQNLISAVKTAGNVHLGLAFRLQEAVDDNFEQEAIAATKEHQQMARAAWRIPGTTGCERFYHGRDPIANFTELAEVAQGIGYLSLKPDSDGVFRRTPLLVRYGDLLFPGLSLSAVCDFLGVTPERIVVKPGKIVLRDAVYPGRQTVFDMVIPIDTRANLRINFVGPWDRMQHYRFGDVYKVTEEVDLLKIWRDELSGKIVLVSDISTGSADVGKVPTDPDYPLSGIHANTVNTLLTGAFFRDISAVLGLAIEIGLLLGVGALSLHRAAAVFTFGTLAGGCIYLLAVGVFLLLGNILLPVIRPLVLMCCAMIGLLVVSTIENVRSHTIAQKAKEIAEKDLEIGRAIQTGFFPDRIPTPAGWEIAAYFTPARQVAGDFYDVFELDNGRLTAVVIADVCDKGVGAALFMAMTRSLVRAFAQQTNACCGEDRRQGVLRIEERVRDVVRRTNNYIADTHAEAGMFATLFLGILEPQSGTLIFANCGHEPPLIVCKERLRERLKATGPAVGIMPAAQFRVDHARLENGELLFAYTDGVTDAENKTGRMFGRERLLELLTMPAADRTADELLRIVKRQLDNHISDGHPSDDITMIAVRRHG